MASDVEQFIAEVLFETKKLQTGVREGVDVLRGFEKTSEKTFERFAEIADRNFKKVEEQFQNLNLQEAQQELEGFAASGKAALDQFIGNASQVEQFRITLETLTGSVEQGAKEFDKLQDFAAATPFNLEEVVAAGVTLKSFQADVDRFLPLAGDLASVFGRNIKDSARALGKALGGSQDGIQILADSFGISRVELERAGAVMKSTGAISLDTADDISALADAIEKVSREKQFTGAIEKQLQSISGNVSQLEDAGFRLAAAVGGSLSGAFISLTQVATNFVSTIEVAPPFILALAGGATALATASAAGTAGLIGLSVTVTALGPLLKNLKMQALEAAAAVKALGASGRTTTIGSAALVTSLSAIGAAIIGGGVLFALNEYEQAALRAGRAIKDESLALSGTFSSFQKYRNAVADATDQSRDFVSIGDASGKIVRDIGEAIDSVDGSKFTEVMAGLGITLASLNQDLTRNRQNHKDFQDVLRATRDRIKEIEDLQKQSPSSQFGADLVALDAELETLREQEKTYERVVGKAYALVEAQEKGVDKLSETEAIYQTIQTFAGKQLADLAIKANTSDLERSNELLKETEGRISQVKHLLSSAGYNFDSLEQIQDLLANAKSDGLKTSLQSLLDLIKERDKLEKQSSRLAEESSRKRVDAILEESEGIEESAGKIRFLKQALTEINHSSAQRKRILKELGQAERENAAERKRQSAETISQAIFEASTVEGGAERKIAALQRVLEAYSLEGEQRRQVLRQISRAEQELAAERKKRRKEEAEGYQNEAFRQQELIISAIDDRIEKLREEESEGKNRNSEIIAALKERAQAEIELAEARTEVRKKEAKSAEVAAEIEKTGQMEIEEIRRKVEKAIKDQKDAQDERIKKFKNEKDAALDAIGAEKKAREDALGISPPSPSSSPIEVGPTIQGAFGPNAPGQTFAQMAGELASIGQNLKPRTGQGEDRVGPTFAEVNPAIWERMQKEDEAVQERIAKEDKARQEAIAERDRAKQDEVAQRMAEAREAILEWQRVDAARRELEQAKQGGSFEEIQKAQGRVDSAEAAYNMEQARKKFEVKALPIETLPLGEKIEEFRQKQEQKAQSEKTIPPTNINIVFEFDDKGQKVIKSAKVKRASGGIDGQQADVIRTLNGFSLKVGS